jgi:hypothetical protein
LPSTSMTAAAESSDRLAATSNSDGTSGTSRVRTNMHRPPLNGVGLSSAGCMTTTDDSEDSDFPASNNPSDRFCKECEIQFTSYKTYKVSRDALSIMSLLV